MQKITSFCVDHTKLDRGMYVSRVDGDVITYDIRMCKPNGGVYLENASMHTMEHLFATYVRNSVHADSILYVGPMGCRTGFYFLTRDTLSRQQAISLIQGTFLFIVAYYGEIPGNSAVECGNYLEHDLPGAKQIASGMVEVLKEWHPRKLAY